MAIGFETENLDAAVNAVISEAARLGQADLIDQTVQHVDLRDRDHVRAYLKRRVAAVYARARASEDGIQLARIEDIVYRGIGFLFESYDDAQSSPLPESIVDGDKIHHLAIFWENLSR
ncbi:hypothetical protein [Candidatus Burkholderia verschuerenii]|uniref:hypothetical protein n=1 Tax=Candidatus Burkholderia verschuerenii TaxID=242163 RepID=UPI00067DB89F|nr:hypothetical protein [Candidatus Burkholderia verschuerenii]